MSRFKTIFLLLISLCFVNSCSPIKGLKRTETADNGFLQQQSVLGKEFNNLLFRANIEFHKNKFSGLVFIKNNIEKDLFNIVLMSEFGLSLMDMTYQEQSIKTNNIQGFMDKRVVRNRIEDSFYLILSEFGVQEYQLFVSGEKQTKVIKIRDKFNRYYYFCNQDNKFHRIVKRKFGKNRLEASLEYDNGGLPVRIVFESKSYQYRMELELLNK